MCHWRRPALVALALACGPARAHSPFPGVGDFYGGMLHPLVVPAHLMAIVAMGSWLGQRWPASVPALIATLAAVPVGMAAGAAAEWSRGETVVLALAGLVAVAVAAAREIPVAARAVVGGVLGLALGMDSLPDGLTGRALWLSLAGTWLACLLGLAWMVALGELAARPWMKVGLRVVAAWVAAAAMLVLALSWAGPNPARAAAGPAAPAAGLLR